MTTSSLAPPPSPSPAYAEEGPALRRIGAVARMLRMPVATLRVWERRYGLTQARLTASGQRLYATEDLRRLALIKQLTELGHAIGSLAPLDMAQLQRVAANHAGTLTATASSAGLVDSNEAVQRPWRVAVIGAALGARLQRPTLLRRLARTVVWLGPFDNLSQAAAALKKSSDVDALLMHEPQLHAGWLAAVEAAAPALSGVPRAVLYGFAADAVCESLATVGITLLREPQPDAVVGQWLKQFAQATTQPSRAAFSPVTLSPAVPPRRWDDAALTAFASSTSTVACECPRHVAELLVQLAGFERYSAECENLSPADAELHAYLQQLAAESRARFEAALEHVALHEGLVLPVSP